MKTHLGILALLGWLLSTPGWAQTEVELATRAANVLGIGREGQCSSCHSLSSRNTINRWSTATKRVEACLEPDTSSRDKLACISQAPVSNDLTFTASQLGIYSAAIHLSPIRTLITDTFAPNIAEDILKRLTTEVEMPMNSTQKLSAAQFEDVRRWFAAGTPEFDFLVAGQQPGSNTCEASFSPALSSHLASARVDSWKTRIEAQRTPMFACPAGSGGNRLDCFTQKRANTDIFPDVSSQRGTASWKLLGDSRMRVLTTFAARRQYWIRSSADGRFVGYGGSPSSGIIDLQSLLAATPSTRIISVSALYDPGFLPDDSGFIFQSNRTSMCNMSILRNSSTRSITFTEDACTVLGSKIPLYQTIGASLNGEDYLALTSTYQRDSGTNTTMDEFNPSEDLTSGPQNQLSLFNLSFDGQSWIRRPGQTFSTPYEIDWVLSHSNQLGMSRVQAERDDVVRTTGFNLYRFDKKADDTWAKVKLATLCGEGLKGDFSYDERFYVNYTYVRPDHWKMLGYASARDPEFQAKLTAGSADLVLYDLLTQKSYALTNMKSDQYALFPHFRADGWIYFEVYDGNTGVRSVLATDAAIRAEASAR